MARRRNARTTNKGRDASRPLTKKQVTEVKKIATRQIVRKFPIQQEVGTIVSGLASGTLFQQALFTGLIGTVLPKSNATQDLPLYQLPGSDYRSLKIMITGIYINGLITGSQGNTLLPADIYNNVRMRMVWNGDSFLDPQTLSVPSSITSPFDTRHSTRTYFDKTFYLPTITFDSSNNAVPTQRPFRKFIKINRVIEAFSTTTTGTTADWDTKEGNLMLYMWSDSAVSPHPTVEAHFSLFYKYIQ